MTKPLALLALLAFAPALLHAQADEQLRQAISRYENLEIERARALFDQVISVTTPFPVTEAQRVVAYKYLGAILATLNRRDTAITFFLAAIGRDPLVDLDRSFGEQERQVFQEARGRTFRIGMRPIVRDTLDPRSERTNFTIASTHNGLVRVELVSTFDDSRITLFEGDVDGPRDIPFNGLSPRGGGLIPRGAYDLVVTGQSRTRAQQADSTSRLIEISWDRTALEDTIAAFGPNDILPTRQPPSAATRDLLIGVGIAAGAIISANLVGQADLEGRTSLASGVAVVAVGSGLYAFLHRRNHPEIPENIVENAARQQRRATANARIMARNTARIDATKIIIRPLGQ
jgi:uncharacterized protein (UPF0335 family)